MRSIIPTRITGGLLSAGICIALSGCAQRTGPLVAREPGTPPTRRAAHFPTPKPPFVAPAVDPFYIQPGRATLARLRPGAIFRYRSINARAYHLKSLHVRAWQVLYRSNDSHGRPVADVATLLVPPRPKKRLLSYQVAYDGLTQRCAPSREILNGGMIEQLFVSRAVKRGWPVVLPDYEGPKSAFTAGINSGRGVLDGIRAARAFLPLVGPRTPIALWGYSGGAYASLWASQLAGHYAPNLPIIGIAAGGPPANLLGVARHIDGGLFAGVYFAAIIGLSRAYPDAFDTRTLLNTKGRKMFQKLNASCVGQELAWVRDPLLSGYAFTQMSSYVTVDDLLAVPAVKKIAQNNRLGGTTLPAPLFYYQAYFDEFTPRDQARALAVRYCQHDVPVRFDFVFGEHVSAAVTHAADAMTYLADRFNNKPPPDCCAQLIAAGSPEQ